MRGQADCQDDVEHNDDRAVSAAVAILRSSSVALWGRLIVTSDRGRQPGRAVIAHRYREEENVSFASGAAWASVGRRGANGHKDARLSPAMRSRLSDRHRGL